jgi:hypothetical protein
VHILIAGSPFRPQELKLKKLNDSPQTSTLLPWPRHRLPAIYAGSNGSRKHNAATLQPKSLKASIPSQMSA